MDTVDVCHPKKQKAHTKIVLVWYADFDTTVFCWPSQVVHPGKPWKAEQALKRAEECLGNRNRFSLFLVTAGV